MALVNVCKRCNKEFISSRKAKACSSSCRNWLYVQTRKEQNNKLSRESYHKRKLYPSNIIRRLLSYAKRRALLKKLEFTLTKEDIQLPDKCPILGVPFDSTRYSYSIDRINPMKGYTKDNIQIISHRANAMKWDSNREERLAFAQWVLASEGGQ